MPLSYPDVGSFPWLFHLNFLPQEEPKSDAEVITINKLKVIKTTEVGLCAHPAMTVLGKKYNYSFSSSCAQEDDLDAQFEYLEEIIKSVKLD